VGHTLPLPFLPLPSFTPLIFPSLAFSHLLSLALSHALLSPDPPPVFSSLLSFPSLPALPFLLVQLGSVGAL